MKQLTVLRHAKSSWSDPQLQDFDRPLNERGRGAAQAVGREMKRRRITFDHVVASPAVRVRQTLQFLGLGFGQLPELNFQQQVYAASLESLTQTVAAIPQASESVLLVGHNPGLQELILSLAANSAERTRVAHRYPTGAATVLQFKAPTWRDLSGGEIVALILPRELAGA